VSDEWMRTHKGDYVKTVALVWYCDDEICGCYQARITKYFRNKVTKNTWVFETFWEGGFYTEHQYRRAEDDLVRYRQWLKTNHPDLEEAIEWESNIDYEREIGPDNDD
jgi:hypothetical protein